MRDPMDRSTPDTAGATQSREEARRRTRVLVADDDAEMRSLVSRALRRDGYQVVEATNGADVVDLLGRALGGDFELGVDAIVSDIRMPALSGLDAVAALRNAGLGLPIVLITAFGDPETHAEAARLGATAVLDKPFDMDDLRTALLGLAPPWLQVDEER